MMENFKKVLFFEDRKRSKKKFKGDKGHSNEIRIVSEVLKDGGPAPINFVSLVATTSATLGAVESLGQGSIVTVKHK